MFSAHDNKNQFYNKNVMLDTALVASPPKTLKKEKLQKIKILFEK